MRYTIQQLLKKQAEKVIPKVNYIFKKLRKDGVVNAYHFAASFLTFVPQLFPAHPPSHSHTYLQKSTIWCCKFPLYYIGSSLALTMSVYRIIWRLRPVLPPPFTPIYFLGISCCRATKCFSTFFRGSYSCGSDHPDVISSSSSQSMRKASAARFGNVYRNPSVPLTQTAFAHFKVPFVASKEILS